jgi:dTMP kinase
MTDQKKTAMRGKFITFEGPEGSGKSTQARLLVQDLKNDGREVVVTREPGGTAIGDAIRAILLNPELQEMDGVTELLLLAASRAQNVRQRVKPALERGCVVVCDRFTDSTLAYQGYGRKFDLKLLRSLNSIATGGIFPDLTILLDLPVELGLERAKALQKAEARGQAGDRFEQEEMDFHRRLREGFLKLAAAEPQRFRVIPVQAEMEATHKQVAAAAREFLRRG